MSAKVSPLRSALADAGVVVESCAPDPLKREKSVGLPSEPVVDPVRMTLALNSWRRSSVPTPLVPVTVAHRSSVTGDKVLIDALKAPWVASVVCVVSDRLKPAADAELLKLDRPARVTAAAAAFKQRLL